MKNFSQKLLSENTIADQELLLVFYGSNTQFYRKYLTIYLLIDYCLLII